MNTIICLQNGTAALPEDTFLQSVSLLLHAGDLIGVDDLEIGLNARVTYHPPGRINSATQSEASLHSLSVLSGGVMEYTGEAELDQELRINLEGDFKMTAGALMTANKVDIRGGNHCQYFLILDFY